ncbi:MAG: lysophospholipid acyltransferase family protein [Ignavibacteriae bacterium]|nr:lysophospholipid acyltransferase family protein [Ignavibacteriota bacterium]
MKQQKVSQKFLQFLGIHFIKYFINVLLRTLRISEVKNKKLEDLEKENKNYVLAFWHGTMLLPWYLKKNENFYTIISKSKDGEILSRVLTNWNYNVERGSSSKGGSEVLNVLIDKAKSGSSISITPDGPRGPEKELKAGAVIIAKKTGIPLVLLGIRISKKVKLSSWDKFQIPYPFAKVSAVYSEPIFIDKDLSYQETDEMIKKVSIELNSLQKEAEQYC